MSEYIEVRSTACRAGMDGDCFWPYCPQERDGEPVKSGRHCPLDSLPNLAFAQQGSGPDDGGAG